MTPATLELMHDQIRAIYRAVTGSEMAEPAEVPEEEALAPDEVERRFADLDVAARSIPAVARRVPPFSFAPPLDAIEGEHEVVIMVAVPGVERADVQIAHAGNTVTVSGVRRGERASNGRAFFCAEIQRGPFYRSIALPYPIQAEPRVHVEGGTIFVHVAKPQNNSFQK